MTRKNINENGGNLVFENEVKKDQAILVGVNLNNDPTFEHSMKELKALTEACDMEVVCIHTQNLPNPNTALYVGPGKVKEIQESLTMYEANTVIFDNALSPIQVRNLTEELNAVVLDRTALILQIFNDIIVKKCRSISDERFF